MKSSVPSPLKILLLTNEYPLVPGGIATYSYEISRHIHKLGQPISVIAASKTDKDILFDQTHDVPIRRSSEPKNPFLRHLERLYLLLALRKQAEPDVLWASDWRCALTVATVATLMRKPYVVTAYGSELLNAQDQFASRKLSFYVLQKAKTILSISHYTKQILLEIGIPESKITVIPLGVDSQRWHPQPPQVDALKDKYGLRQSKLLLTLARLTPRKGHDVVISALPKVLHEIPNAKYLIAGTGADEKRLRALAKEHGVESNVIFVGYVSEELKSAYYHLCDVFVMLSRREGNLVEGFGLTLLEAGACGKPVIAGDHGGAVDAVIDGQTGYLVDPLDKDKVANKIIELLQNQTLAVQLGKNAQTWIAQEANWETTAVHTLQAISNAIKKV